MLWMVLAFALQEVWEAFDTDPTDPASRARVVELQKNPDARGLMLKFSSTADTSWGMKVTDFFKIDREGTVWVEQRKSSGPDKGLRTLYMEKINCVDKTMGLVSGVTYNANGTVKSSGSTSIYSVEMSYAIPGSTGENLVAAACRNFE